MLAYGSAEASLRLLWRFGLLEHLLPFQVSPWHQEGTYIEIKYLLSFWFLCF